MRRTGVAVVVLSCASFACGRFGFEPAGSAGDTTSSPDGSVATDAPDEPAVAPLLWLPMDDGISDGVITDASGRGNDAKCVNGGKCPQQVEGRIGMALAGFTTNAPGIEIPDSPTWRLASSFTLSAWVRLPDHNGNTSSMVVTKPLGPETANSYQLEVQRNGRAECTIEGAESRTVTSSIKVPHGEWIHLACTYDGELRLYIGGTLVGAGPGTTIEHDDQPVLIGCDRNWGDPSACNRGAIDEVRIFAVPLSEDEVIALAR